MSNEEMLEQAKVLTAKANGVECERSLKSESPWPWMAWGNEPYDPITFRYRVKPEPEPVVNEWWVNLYPSGAVSLHPTPERAREEAARDATDATEVAVHVVRADSKLADLVTDEQMVRSWSLLHARGLFDYTAQGAKKLLEAVDDVRETT